jgi:phage terminase Nu1 subunit (DNA packaging protein)
VATVAEGAAHLFMSAVRFQEFVAQGVIAKAERGAYDLDAVRESYIKHIRKKASNRAGDADGLTEARADLAREQTAAVALKNAVARNQYAPLAVIMKGVEMVISTFRERALAIPGKIATTLEMRSRGEVEELLRAELNEALDELSRPIVTAADLAGDSGDDSGSAGESALGGEAAAEPQSD